MEKDMPLTPGHFKAYTFWLITILVISAIAQSDNPDIAMGIILILAGAFLGDQATHLAQAHHAGPADTAIEGLMQRYRWLFVFIGTGVALLGLQIILFSIA